MKSLLYSVAYGLSACTLLTPALLAHLLEETLLEEEVMELAPVLVTANRVATPISETGNAFTIITREELIQRQPFSVFDALAVAPGVITRRNGGPGGTSSVSIRGTNDTQSLILIDGIRLVDPANSSSVNLDLIPAANIERIEVLRGSNSVVYGADAIGGVINIITQKPSDQSPTTTVDISGGSFETARIQARVQGHNAGFSYSAFISHFETDGFSRLSPDNAEADDFERTHLDLFLGYDFNKAFNIRGSYKFTDSQSDYDGFNAPNDTTRFDNIEQHYFLLESILKVADGRWTSHPMLSYTQSDSDLPADFFFINSDQLNFDWQNNVNVSERIDLVGGFEYEELTGQSPTNFDQSNNTSSFYLLAKWSPVENLFFDLGGRIDDNSDYGSEETWRVAGTYLIAQTGTRIFANYGTSFRAPVIAQLFNPNFGNPALTAETGRSYDIGIVQSLLDNRIEAGLTFFNNDIDDQIAFDTSLPGPFGGRFNNIDKVQTQGYEMYVTAEPIENLSVTLNYTWLDAEDKNSDLDLARRPHNSFSGVINWLTLDEKLNLNLIVTYRGERFDGSNESRPMGGYTVVDFAATYTVNERLEFYGKVENLFDRDYEDITGFATADISAYFGARYSFW